MQSAPEPGDNLPRRRRRNLHALAVDQIYAAVLQPELWQAALQAAADVMRAQGANFLLWSSRGSGVAVAESIGNPPEGMRAYAEHYYRLDPMVGHVQTVPLGFWCNDWVMGGSAFAGSEWYNDFLRPHLCHANLAAMLLRDSRQWASVSFQRFIGQPVFTAKDEAVAQRLFPHLARAAKLHLRMQELGLQAALGRATLEHVAAPVMVLEADGELLLANGAAERLCSCSRLLTIHNGRLLAPLQLQEWNHALLIATNARGAKRPVALHLRGRDSATELRVLVCPLAETTSLAAPWQRALALVVVHQIGAIRPSVDDLLRQLFHLTDAEARVARLVAEGLSPIEISDRLQLSSNTVRTQLKSAFQKVGVHRQAELARLVAEFGTFEWQDPTANGQEGRHA